MNTDDMLETITDKDWWGEVESVPCKCGKFPKHVAFCEYCGRPLFDDEPRPEDFEY